MEKHRCYNCNKVLNSIEEIHFRNDREYKNFKICITTKMDHIYIYTFCSKECMDLDATKKNRP